MRRLKLLGSPSLMDGEHRVEGIAHKSWAMLAFLALSGESTRETLAGLLWGDLAQDRAQANLRNALHDLARVAPGIVVADARAVRLDRAAVEVDEGGEGPLLEGIRLRGCPELEQWVERRREELARRAHARRVEEGRACVAAGDLAGAEAAAREALGRDPLAEDAHALLLEALMRRGDVAAARRHLEKTEALFDEELGAPPSERLREIIEAPPPVAREPAPAAPAAALGPIPWSVVDHFQGRSAELAKLVAALQDPAVRMTTVSGRGGMGKTTLAVRAIRELAGTAVLFVSATPGVPPLERIVELAGRVLDPPARAALAAAWRGDRPLRERVEHLLCAALGARPVLIVLDEAEAALDPDGAPLPWAADISTLIEGILEWDHATRLLVTSRRPLRLPPALAGRAGKRLRAIPLAHGLDEVAGLALLRALDPDGSLKLRDAREKTLRAWLDASHGIPRNLEVLAGHLRQSARPDPERLLASGAGAAVGRDAARALYDGLGAAERRMLEAIAALRVSPEPDDVVRMSGETDAALDALLARHAVRLDGPRLVLHALDREHALARLAAPERTSERIALHRLAAAYHAARRGPKPWSANEDLEPLWEEIHHRREAGDVNEVVAVLDEIEGAVGFWTEQNRRIARVREGLVGTLGDPGAEELNHGRLAGALYYARDASWGADHYERAIALARKGRRDEHLPTWLIGLATAYRFHSDPERAVRCLREALAVARRRGDAAQVSRVQHARSAIAVQMRRFDDALKAAAEALACAKGTPAEFRARTALTRTLLMAGRLADARREATRSLEDSPAQPVVHRALAHGMMASVCEQEGRDAEAMEQYERVLAIAVPAGVEAAVDPALLSLGDLHLAAGRFDEARRIFEERARRVAAPAGEMDARLALLDLTEKRDGARERLEKLLERLEAAPRPHESEWVLASIYANVGLGRTTRAIAVAREGARALRGAGLLMLVRGKLRWLEGRAPDAVLRAFSPRRLPRSRA
jgi:DNA-binding SARP family transcriptional activator